MHQHVFRKFPAVQVNKLEITTDKRLLAAAGNPHIRLFEVASGNNQAVLTYEGHTNNVTAVCSMLTASPFLSAIQTLSLHAILLPQQVRDIPHLDLSAVSSDRVYS